MPDRKTALSRRDALSMLTAAPLAGVSAWPAAAQSRGETRWVPKLAKRFVPDKFDSLQVHLGNGGYHGEPDKAFNIVRDGYGVVLRSGDAGWTPITAAISDVRTHPRRPGSRAPFLTGVVLMLQGEAIVHIISYSFSPGMTDQGLRGELDDEPVFLNRQLPELIARLRPSLNLTPSFGYR